MNALLIMAHGSPRAEANADIVRVAEVLRERETHPLIVVGYLDCNEPTIPDALDQCVADGATRIAAVPYLLHTGRHFLIDLPQILEAASQRHPGVEIVMGDYVGHQDQVAEVLRDRVAATPR